MPDVAYGVLEILKGDEADLDQLLNLVGRDPAMATTILRTANSAAFGGLGTVDDLEQGVLRLGMRQVARLVTALIHRGHFVSRHPARQDVLLEIWEDAVASAIVCQRLANRSGGKAGLSFLAGLLHDTGKLLLLRGVEQDEEKRWNDFVPIEALRKMMVALHCPLGYRALRTWDLPERLCLVARDHHRDDLDATDGLVSRVQLAGAIVRKATADPCLGPGPSLLEHPASVRLRLTEDDLASVITGLEDEIQAFRQLV
jgi:HD-like signal output (HDOD) protein